jgi:CelD/BcsL family acetyltransferase involved in cellulose biosynthesis
MRFERMNLADVDWQQLDSLPDRTLCQTRPWINFIASTQQSEPVIARLQEGKDVLGYFTGGIVKKLGLRILGSPFPGWTTSYMGFNLYPDVSRAAALRSLVEFAFGELRCIHLELMDRNLTEADTRAIRCVIDRYSGYEVDLTPSEDCILATFENDPRRRIRRAAEQGVTVEEALDMTFADDYYAQLEEVFSKRKLKPTYDKARVRALIEHLLPTGMLLLLRARDAAGRCIATGIFPASNDTAYYWGGASWRADLRLSPNDSIQWYAMRYWKARGMTRYDMGGAGEYKAKYGGNAIAPLWIRMSKYEFLTKQRDRLKQLYWQTRRIGFIQKYLKKH